MLGRGGLVGAFASVLFLTACASPQQAAGAGAAAAGLAAGTYGVAITGSRCVAYEPDHRDNPRACISENKGHPEIGVPILIGSAALVVTGAVLLVLDAEREKPPHNVQMRPPEVVHRDESGYDTLK